MKNLMSLPKLSLLFLFCIPFIGHAQLTFHSAVAPQPFLPASAIIPVPGSSITWTQIMFDHPAVPRAVRYDVTVIESDGKNGSASQTISDSSTATWMGGFHFGRECTWFYTAYDKKNKMIFRSPDYTFTILPLPSRNRVRVATNHAAKNQGGLISFDYHCMIVDREGSPVWFLPEESKKEFSRDDKVRDIRITSAGTITFITNRNAFEIMTDGRISWRGPKMGPHAVETLHHGVERLPNGNIMTLGNHTVKLQVPGDTAKIPVEFSVIVEYDRKGSVVWKWDSYNYLYPDDVEFRKLPDGRWTSSSHMNAFRQVQEGNSVFVYAGFRDLDRIIRIEKATGIVDESYGRNMRSGKAWTGDNFFHAQHDVTPLSDGTIAVFNNDSVSKDGVVSSIVIFSRAKKGEESKVTWRFACDFDKLTTGKSEKCGSVDELPNKNLLVNFGNINRCIEITRDGEIVWDAFTEYAPSDTSGWLQAGQYRSHFAPSLYPVWFTGTLQSNAKKSVTISIWNEGITADTYTVEYLVGKNWVRLASVELQPERHTNCIIPKTKAAPFTKIRVISGLNPDFIRTITL